MHQMQQQYIILLFVRSLCASGCLRIQRITFYHRVLFHLSGDLTAKTGDSGRYKATGMRLLYGIGHWHVVGGFICCVGR